MKKAKQSKSKVAKKSANKSPAKKQSVLLPAHVRPQHYKIHLEPDLKKFTFKGQAHIDLDIAKPTKEIHLHARDLELHAAQIEGSQEQAHAIAYDAENERVVLHFEKPLVGKQVVAIEYEGIINDTLSGFYRSRYQVGSETRYLGTTQFEATDARAAFPCMDEPAAKAAFEFSFTVPEEHVVVSNTQPVQETLEQGKRHVVFAPTPKMSSYLAAFVIGDLAYIEGKTKKGVRVRVYAVRGKEHLGAFALDVAIRGLEFDEQFFGVPYPLATLDLIALPDFASAAMENWGAITFREASLLLDPQHSSEATKQTTVETIVHELAHMWFGNLVTMQWWTHLWLNESFATWLSYHTTDHLFPEWRVWTQFISSRHLIALHTDSLRTTHPIEVPVYHPREIREVFDVPITYCKGSAIVRMIADYLGDKKFQSGVSHYMKKHSYGNTVTEDLWDALAEASGEDVRNIMKNWTQKPGYPLLTVKKVQKGILIEQERFFLSQAEAKKGDPTLWQVPVSMSVGSEQNIERLLLTKRKQLIPVDWTKHSWIKLNFKSSSFCRVRYDNTLLLGLREAKRTGQLKARDRIGIAADLVALGRSGHIRSDEALATLLWFADEKYYTIWAVVAGGLASLSRILRDTSLHSSMEKLAQKTFVDIVDLVGWKPKKGETELEVLLRSLVLTEAGKYGVREVVIEARKLLDAHAKGSKELPPDIRSAVYQTVARSGSKKEYDLFISLLKKATLQEEQNRLQRAVVCFSEPRLLQQVVTFVFGDHVRDQDRALLAVSLVANNPAATPLLWKYLEAHWQEVVRLGTTSGMGYWSRLIEHLVASITDPTQLKHVERFLVRNMWKGGTRGVAQGVETAKANIVWRKRAVKELTPYFPKEKKR